MQKVAYLFFCKDNANRRQYKINSFIFIVEVPLILSKDNANRRQYKINPCIFIVEVPLILFKTNANHLLRSYVYWCLMLPVSLAAR